MIRKIDKRGQTALILILLGAAALIFLAITLNWGRIAQVKSMITIAADEAATTLASDSASYGEMEKQTYLENENVKSSLDGVFLDFILMVIAIVLLFVPIPGLTVLGAWLMVIAAAMSVVTLVLQLVVINPMISSLWNNLQKNQPNYQQFYEQGITSALQSSVTDQTNITDYFDWNANGVYGNNAAGFPRDNVSRFALYYTDRLKMLNQSDIPQVIYFYDQLAELINGSTCGQNQGDNYNYATAVDAGCQAAGVLPFSSPPCNDPTAPPCTTAGINCVTNPIDPVCQEKIPNGFQLNDSCVDSSPASPNYNPYCDPCCQPVNVVNPLYCIPANPPTSPCTGKTSSGAACNCNPLAQQYISIRPSSCDQSASPAQCSTNNPYNASPGGPYPLLYDPAFQEYNNKLSFLDQFGRDQQTPPAIPPPGQTFQMTPDAMTPSTVTPPLVFPNGVYPFFWLMNDYSPEVDNIDPTTTILTPDQYHWCVAGGSVPVAPPTPTGFPDLAQLTLPYTCTGQYCCVDHLLNSLTSNGSVNSSPITITIVNGPAVSITSPAVTPSYYLAGNSVILTATASEAGGTITQISLYDPVSGLIATCPISPPASPATCSDTLNNKNAGTNQAYAIATDSNGVSSPQSATITEYVIDPPTVSITAPAQGTSLAGGSSVTITAVPAIDPNDTMSSVTFYNNGVSIGTANSSPYNLTWTVPAAPPATYSLTAVATDTHGFSSAQSSAVTGPIT